MIISEEKDYFIYGCISTLFVESILCIIYGCIYDLKCHKSVIARFGKTNQESVRSNSLLTEHIEEFNNNFDNIPDDNSSPKSFIDL